MFDCTTLTIYDQIKIAGFLLCVLAVAVKAQQLPTELQTPEIVAINRMPMRSSALDIGDFKTIATLDQNYKNGLLSVSTEISNYRIDHSTNHSRPDTFSVALDLRDPNGKSVYNDQTKGIKIVLGN